MQHVEGYKKWWDNFPDHCILDTESPRLRAIRIGEFAKLPLSDLFKFRVVVKTDDEIRVSCCDPIITATTESIHIQFAPFIVPDDHPIRVLGIAYLDHNSRALLIDNEVDMLVPNDEFQAASFTYQVEY